jgi:hypothetical protein
LMPLQRLLLYTSDCKMGFLEILASLCCCLLGFVPFIIGGLAWLLGLGRFHDYRENRVEVRSWWET